MGEVESQFFLSPCLSTATVVPGGCLTMDFLPMPAPLSEIKILLPDFVESKTVKMEELRLFVASYASAETPVTILHLLIYVFSKNWTSDMTFLSDVKLIHMGKQYRLTRAMDLHSEYAELASTASRFPTFQLLVAPNQVLPAVTLTVPELMARSFEPKRPEDEIPVTYAEAVVKLFKLVSRRRSSKGCVITAAANSDSAGSGGETSTNSSYNENKRRKRHMVRLSWRKVVSCVSVHAH